MCPHTLIYTYRYAELERQAAAREGDLTNTNEGLASRNGVIEWQLIEFKVTYKGARFICFTCIKVQILTQLCAEERAEIEVAFID